MLSIMLIIYFRAETAKGQPTGVPSPQIQIFNGLSSDLKKFELVATLNNWEILH